MVLNYRLAVMCFAFLDFLTTLLNVLTAVMGTGCRWVDGRAEGDGWDGASDEGRGVRRALGAGIRAARLWVWLACFGAYSRLVACLLALVDIMCAYVESLIFCHCPAKLARELRLDNPGGLWRLLPKRQNRLSGGLHFPPEANARCGFYRTLRQGLAKVAIDGMCFTPAALSGPFP